MGGGGGAAAPLTIKLLCTGLYCSRAHRENYHYPGPPWGPGEDEEEEEMMCRRTDGWQGVGGVFWQRHLKVGVAGRADWVGG